MPSMAESLRRWRKKNLKQCPESVDHYTDGTAGHLFPGELLLFQRGTLVIQYSGQTVHIASWGNWEWLLWDQAESCFVVVLLGGSTGESSPVDGNSTATIALSTLLAAASATLGTLGIAATLL